MPKDVQYGTVEQPVNEDDQVGARMKKRDEYLKRQLRRLRLVGRILGFIAGLAHSVLC